MPYQKTEIDGVFLFIPKIFEDSRGVFYESFGSKPTLAETNLEFKVAQVNTSMSSRGVIRGVHFKESPPGQKKFVSVVSGGIIDVAVDLRRSSTTFRKWQAFELNEYNRHSLLLGNGIGHAFLALRDETRVTYLCDTSFEPEKEHAINPLTAGICWEKLGTGFGRGEFLLSDKDRNAPNLSDDQWPDFA